MGGAKDICEICEDIDYDSSSYVIFYNLSRVSHIVSPIGETDTCYERFPFVSFDSTCFRYCYTDYFTETYRSNFEHGGKCQYVDRSVCEYYPVVVGREGDGVALEYKQYMLKYEIYDVVMPTLIYHKGYENYLPILMHMLNTTHWSHSFVRFYRENLLKFRTNCDIIGKVVEDYVDYISSEKEKCVSCVSQLLVGGNKYASDFRSKLEELRTTNTTVDGKLMLENIEKNSKLVSELLGEGAPCAVYVSTYSTDLLEIVKIIRTLGTSHDTACGV